MTWWPIIGHPSDCSHRVGELHETIFPFVPDGSLDVDFVAALRADWISHAYGHDHGSDRCCGAQRPGQGSSRRNGNGAHWYNVGYGILFHHPDAHRAVR